MGSNKLKVSLIAIGIVALGLAAASFFVSGPQVTEAPTNGQLSVGEAIVEIDFGDGRVERFTTEVNESKNLFQVMLDVFAEQELEFSSQNYSGLGQLITRIGDKKSGDEGKYWQFWVNGEYSIVGASAYIAEDGDIIKWKFTDEVEE
jgi:plasmid maintenance system killer protein